MNSNAPSSIDYSYLPEFNAAFTGDASANDLSFGGNFGIVDYYGYFVYGSLAIAIVLTILFYLNISLVPKAVSGYVARVVDRLDIGVDTIRQNVMTVRDQIKGRNLPLDDKTLDSLTIVVLDALDAYEGFNNI